MPTLASSRLLGIVVACCVSLAIGGCFGDDVTPQNTSVAGKWQITCQPVNEDCPDFAISFDVEGDITDFNLDGHKGAARGRGSVVEGKLAFKVGLEAAYDFSGMLNSSGRIAAGSMTNYDYDGMQKTTQAIATRQ